MTRPSGRTTPVTRTTLTPRRISRARSTAPVVYDLFAGAGLFSHAFEAEGFRVERAVELDVVAAETYSAQVGPHIEIADVRTVRPTGACDVLIAGPPCQGFSTLGRRAENDPRNLLSLEVAKWAAHLHPSVVVVENVAAFVGTGHHDRLLRALQEAGYATHTTVLNAIDAGVAQRRARSFTIASRRTMPAIFLQTTHVATVREALDGLPTKPTGENQHYAPRPSPLALARMKLIPPGGDRRDVMRRNPALVPPSWRSLGTRTKTVEVTDAWGRLRWDQPANTLRTGFNNASKGRYLHPSAHRVLSLREAARLHSIPDSWLFAGWPIDIARQIGNSVPPALGRAVARAVLSCL